jgi:hypothetical protein
MQSVVDFADQPYLEIKRGEDVGQKLWAARNLPVLIHTLDAKLAVLNH